MKKQTWKRLWARKYSPFGMAGYAMAFTNNPLFLKCLNKLVLPEGRLAVCYFSEQEFRKLARHYIDFLMKQKNLNAYGRKYENKFKHFYLWAKKFSRQNFSKFSNLEIAEELKKLYRWYVEFGDWQYLVWPVIYGPQEKLEQRFANHPEGETILEAIGTPDKITKIMQSRLELLRLVKSRAGRKSFLSYAKKYAWIPVYEFIDKPWRLQEFNNQIKQIKNANLELKSSLAKRRENLHYYANFLKQIRERKLRKLIEICHLFAYLKEMRDDYRRPAFYLLRKFWQEIARRTGLSFQQTNFLIVEELIQTLQTGKKPTLAEIRSRQKQYALVLKNGKLKIYSGAHTNKILKMVTLNKATSNIKGMCTSGGRVCGRVSIILHQEDFKKFKKGQILVTNMTHPEFVPIMKSAKAVVTDEGGIICHAAIVSRELKIPCIVGTKIATKVLRDGQLVEVDANKGIVRILKK